MITITVQQDDGPIETLTAFGTPAPEVNIFNRPVLRNEPIAQTPDKFSANPKSKDGAAGDITADAMGPSWFDPLGTDDNGQKIGGYVNLGVYPAWSDWFNADYNKAGRPVFADCYGFPSMRYWKVMHGANLNLMELGPNQTARMFS